MSDRLKSSSRPVEEQLVYQDEIVIHLLAFNPPPTSSVPQAPSVISAPPTLPPELSHPPITAVPPPAVDHPPATVPPVDVDHPPVEAPAFPPITLPRLPDPPPDAITQVESGLAAAGAAIAAGLGWLAHPHF